MCRSGAAISFRYRLCLAGTIKLGRVFAKLPFTRSCVWARLRIVGGARRARSLSCIHRFVDLEQILIPAGNGRLVVNSVLTEEPPQHSDDAHASMGWHLPQHAEAQRQRESIECLLE